MRKADWLLLLLGVDHFVEWIIVRRLIIRQILRSEGVAEMYPPESK